MRVPVFLSVFSLFVAACGGGGGDTAPIGTPPLEPERISFSGGGALGIFDPSLDRDPGTNRLWMSYSAVDQSQYYDPAVFWGVGIRLAFSDDNGTNWQDAGVVLAPFSEQSVGPLTVTNPAPPINAGSDGIWQSETSSLIYDPAAPAGERWKLFWFQYLHAAGHSHFFDYSWIAMKTAATPLGLANASPVKLFSGLGLQADSEVTGAPAYSPIGGQPAIRLNNGLSNAAPGVDLAELNNCVFAEPGLHASADALHMVMLCADVVADKKFIVQFRCASPCDVVNAANWTYVGRVLTPADAALATAHDHFSAADIVEVGGRRFLVSTPVGLNGGDGYDGCRVYEYAALDSGTLLRTGNGGLIEAARVNGQSGTHHGACTVADGLSGGILLSQFETANPPQTFRIYRSQVRLP